MEILTTTAQVAWAVLLVILGLNALIIVHEFGHFIVARWCGVRCDKFYIWFDAFGYRIFRFRWGQTEYGLGWLPLGGYVKMFGQEDNPGEARAEIERAKLAATSAQDAAEHGETVPENSPTVEQVEQYEKEMYAPDSYLAKSIPQRMAIIVAGVVMNMIFAFICATAAFLFGVKDASPLIGGTMPGSPAWTAGLRTGDRMLEINGKPARLFEDVRNRLLENGSVDLLVKRDGVHHPIELKGISGRKKSNDLIATIGIVNGYTTKLRNYKAFEKTLKGPDAKTLLALYPQEFFDTLALYPDGCYVVAVDGKPVDSYAQIARAVAANPFDAVKLTFDDTKPETRTETVTDEQGNRVVQPAAPQTGNKTAIGRKTVEIPKRPMKELTGVKFAMSPITAVAEGSDAQKAGIEPGDTLLKMGENEIDPLTLAWDIRVDLGLDTTRKTFSVQKQDGSRKEWDATLTPDADTTSVNYPQDELACGPLGIAYGIAGVKQADGSVAKVESVEILGLEKPKEMPFSHLSFCTVGDKSVKYTDIGTKIDLPVILLGILQNPELPDGTEVRINLEGQKDGEGAIYKLATATDWFAIDRNLGALIFEADTVLTHASFGEACVLGLNKTIDSTFFVFTVLKKLVTGQISPKGMGGPVLIVQATYSKVAKESFSQFLILLCLIGANLAVMNILPIPMLDGGHLVFLAYEGITGRQPNPLVFEILCWIGLALLLTLMVWVCLLDFNFIHRM